MINYNKLEEHFQEINEHRVPITLTDYPSICAISLIKELRKKNLMLYYKKNNRQAMPDSLPGDIVVIAIRPYLPSHGIVNR